MEEDRASCSARWWSRMASVVEMAVVGLCVVVVVVGDDGEGAGWVVLRREEVVDARVGGGCGCDCDWNWDWDSV